MDFQTLLDKYKPFVKKNYLPLALGFLGLIFFVYGLIALVGSSSSSNDIVFESSNSSSQVQGLATSKKITVDVEGAVVKPGVYNLPLDSRIKDALVASGGLSAWADREWVSKNLNLAAKLSDGGKIYVPKAGEGITGIKSTTSTTGSIERAGSSGLMEASGLVNVNSAGLSELDTLPGIGPVTAQKIIDNRPYGSVEELLSKKVVSSSVFGKIKEKVSLY